MDKKIILTFDYEIFLGSDSGTVENSLIGPTNEILKLLRQHKSSGIFFVDATYLLVLKKYEHYSLPLVSEQISEIISSGCDIGLHLHPQWLDAYPVGKRWKFSSFEKYDIHSLSDNQIIGLFEQGLEILYQYIKPFQPDYEIKSFRAGGWLINPFEKLRQAFKVSGIKIDSSVLPGVKKETLGTRYDFTSAPDNLTFWRFSYDPCIPDKSGDFWELPVTTFRVSVADLILNQLSRCLSNDKIMGDGNLLIEKKTFLQKFTQLFFDREFRPLTVDNTSEYLFKKSLAGVKSKNLVVWESHPKILTGSGLRFIEYLLENYRALAIADWEKEYSRYE